MSDLDAARQLRRQLRQDHRLLWRMRLARAALLWERVWPAAWPPLAVIGIFAVLALFDIFAALPGWLHIAVLAMLALAFAAAIAWGLRRRSGLPDWRERAVRALTPSFYGRGAAVAASFDLWITPPEYTGLAPQFLRAGDPGPVAIPTGSVLLAQVHGGGRVPQLAIDAEGRDLQPVDKQNFRIEATLSGGRMLSLTQGGATLGQWPIEIVPDNPPAITFAQPPKGTARAALRLDYRASDDYGVESVKAVIHRTGDKPGDPPSEEAIELELPLPGLHLKDAQATSYHDLSPHPWAGLPVEIRVVATDALGQTGESDAVAMTLPERVFKHPVARAIIDQRRELAKDPGSAPAVAEIIGDLNTRPVLYRDDTAVYLALHLAQLRLQQGSDKTTIAGVQQILWETALRIEDGRMALAEQDLRRLQQQLQA